MVKGVYMAKGSVHGEGGGMCGRGTCVAGQDGTHSTIMHSCCK